MKKRNIKKAVFTAIKKGQVFVHYYDPTGYEPDTGYLCYPKKYRFLVEIAIMQGFHYQGRGDSTQTDNWEEKETICCLYDGKKGKIYKINKVVYHAEGWTTTDTRTWETSSEGSWASGRRLNFDEETYHKWCVNKKKAFKKSRRKA